MDAQRKNGLNKKLTRRDDRCCAPPIFDARLFFGTNIDKDLSNKPVDLNSRGIIRPSAIINLRILAIVDEIVESDDSSHTGAADSKIRGRIPTNRSRLTRPSNPRVIACGIHFSRP